MSPFDQAALAVLARLADGKPAFETAACGKAQRVFRKILMRDLYARGWIAKGTWHNPPCVTPAGDEVLYTGVLTTQSRVA